MWERPPISSSAAPIAHEYGEVWLVLWGCMTGWLGRCDWLVGGPLGRSHLSFSLFFRLALCHSVCYMCPPLYDTLTHTCIRTQTHTNTHAYTHKHTHTHARTHSHTHAYARTHTHARTHTNTHAYTHKHTHTHAYTHSETDAHIHTHTHTHKPICAMCLAIFYFFCALALLIGAHCTMKYTRILTQPCPWQSAPSSFRVCRCLTETHGG